jgi:hypothetical protein
MIVVDVIVVGLVAYRVWRLLAVDELTATLRERLGPRTYDFVTCPWCFGFWATVAIGLAAGTAGYLSGSLWLVVPAASVVVGWLGDRL